MAVIWLTGVVFVSFDWNMPYLGKRPLTIGSLPNPQDPVDLLFQFGWIDYQVVIGSFKGYSWRAAPLVSDAPGQPAPRLG